MARRLLVTPGKKESRSSMAPNGSGNFRDTSEQSNHHEDTKNVMVGPLLGRMETSRASREPYQQLFPSRGLQHLQPDEIILKRHGLSD